jgi:DNA-binding NarL/FixJ family response regulator
VTLRLVVVDDHEMVRLGLAAVLSCADDVTVVGSVASGEAAIAAVAELRPDVVLMDLSLPGMSGIEATAAIVRAGFDAGVVIVSTFAEPRDVVAALDAGARGYVLKSIAPDELMVCIRTVAARGTCFSPVASAGVAGPGPAAVHLTARERDVLELILAGNSNRQIATILAISEKTVKTHCGHLFQRLGVRDRTQAALWAERNLRARPRPLAG